MFHGGEGVPGADGFDCGLFALALGEFFQGNVKAHSNAS
jgi:hypothetical protein